MTSSSRRALPWMISLGAHLAAMCVLALALAAPPPPITVPRVDISLVGGTGPGGSMALRGASRPRPGTTAAPRVSASAPQQAGAFPSDAASPSALRAEDSIAAAAGRVQPPASSVTSPPASDVLADVAAVSAGPGAAQASSQDDSAGASAGSQWGWEGFPRKLIRKRDPEFPLVLSAMGQEIEGEARIAVAPSGIVTRVEITRSSGYIEIDASVEQALHDYLFSRVDGKADSVGTVEFRFRLEKQD